MTCVCAVFLFKAELKGNTEKDFDAVCVGLSGTQVFCVSEIILMKHLIKKSIQTTKKELTNYSKLYPNSEVVGRFWIYSLQLQVNNRKVVLPVPGRPMMICLRGAGWGESAGSIRGRRDVGVGWQATGCGSTPSGGSWCPSGFLSLSLPPEPEDDRTRPDELGMEPGMEEVDRVAWLTADEVRDWEETKN